MNFLITGCAGFIGFHLCLSLLKKNSNKIYGIDNLNDYYDVELKKKRLKILQNNKKFNFYKIDFCNYQKLKINFQTFKYDYVIHLGAQAGVRYSILNPKTYLDNNVIGFYNILELSKTYKAKHLIFASTSSVYGDSKTFPLSETEKTEKPLSFYAATKKTNELLAYSYSNIYNLPISGLRFFTVYGPFGRPDMSLFKFTKAILNSKKIELFNNGNHVRDFTYVDDAVNVIDKLIKRPPAGKVPYQVYNVGNDKPISLRKFISIIESVLGKKALLNSKPIQQGDVVKTHANINKIKKKINYIPKTNINDGIKAFIEWYKDYYKQK